VLFKNSFVWWLFHLKPFIVIKKVLILVCNVLGPSSSHDAKRAKSPPICGRIPDPTASEDLPGLLLHLSETVPPAVCNHSHHPTWWENYQVRGDSLLCFHDPANWVELTIIDLLLSKTCVKHNCKCKNDRAMLLKNDLNINENN